MTVTYWLWRVCSFLTKYLPLGVCYRVADLVFGSAYWLLPKRMSDAKANYARVLGKSSADADVRHVTRRAFRNFGRYITDVMRYPHVSQAELDRRVVLHETEEFTQAVDEKRGIILVTAHFGNMELAGLKLARRFSRVTLAAEVLKARKIYEWLVKSRAKHNVHLIPYRKAARSLLTALRENEFIGFFLDLGIRYDHRGVPVSFFGETAYFPAAPALLAYRTGAPIVLGYAVVREDGTIHAYGYPPIRIEGNPDESTWVQVATQQMASNMEHFISRYPDQWYIFRRMWPDGERT